MLPADLENTVLRKTRYNRYFKKKITKIFFLYTLRYVKSKPLVKLHKKKFLSFFLA